MTIPRMSADKSHLLAYLKHTPGFENKVWDFIDLSVEEILANVAQHDPRTHRECIVRFNLQEYEKIPA
ncbi:MAG: hypothetical protein F4W95_00995 [Chloroflexi bacterium]|nr:hypothetical protein [Chloroflexota bacterium]MYD47042.1 hypothetical protein [Chloroflexota bacterium]